MKLLTSYKNVVAASLLAMCFTFNASGGGKTGACCITAVECYDDIPLNDCVAFSGTYMGDGSSCNVDGTCYNAGACCFDPSQCVVLLVQECIENFGTYMGDGSFCNADGTCYNAGACCIDTDECSIVLEQDCIAGAGTYLGDGSFCNPDGSCYNAGACCIDDNGASQCAITLLNDCIDSGGSYAGDGTVCSPDWSCPEEYNSGACCINTACLNMTLMRCEEFNGIYHGNNSFCGDADVECVATCNADLDGDGEVKVADLLLLIAAWGACP